VVIDVARKFEERDVELLARLLGAVRLTEAELDCRESQLHSLADLAEWHELSSAVVAPLVQVRSDAVGSEIEYLGYLLDAVR
jgi:hypothetical protein